MAERPTKNKKKNDVGASQERLSKSAGVLHVKRNTKEKQGGFGGGEENPRGSGEGTSKGTEKFPYGELPPRLLPLEGIPEDSRINTYSKIDYLRDITAILRDTTEYDWLMDSVFGKLFTLPTRYCEFSARLVHNLLCRSLVTEKKNEMWFVFGGKPIRYSLREFAMMTGLNCNPLPPKKERKAMRKVPEGEESNWDTLLGPLKQISIQDLVRLLKADMAEKRPSRRMCGLHKLQLCLVVIVDGILCNNSSTICATRKTVEMVRDVDKFCNYPWGRKSFTRTMRMVKVGKKVKDPEALASKLFQSHMSNYGLTMAFHLLAIYTVPLLEGLIPTAKTDSYFADPQFTGLTKFHPFHNKNILEVENDPALYVDSILSTGHSTDEWDLTWEDEVEDVRVDNIIKALDAGYNFKPEDWKLYEMKRRVKPRRGKPNKPKSEFGGIDATDEGGVVLDELLASIEAINEYHDEKKLEALERIDEERNKEIRDLFSHAFGSKSAGIGEDADMEEQPRPSEPRKRKVRGGSDCEDVDVEAPAGV